MLSCRLYVCMHEQGYVYECMMCVFEYLCFVWYYALRARRNWIVIKYDR